MLRFVISGGTGFVGWALARRLAPAAEVVVLTRDAAAAAARLKHPGISIVETGGACPERLAKVLHQADVVFNLAGTEGAVQSNRNPSESLKSGVEWHLNFLEACAASPRRPHVVFASSRLVYGPPESLPVTETHPVGPRSLYAAHKLCVECYHHIFAQRGTMSYTVCSKFWQQNCSQMCYHLRTPVSTS